MNEKLAHILLLTCIAVCLQVQIDSARGGGEIVSEQTGSNQTSRPKEWVASFERFPGSRLLCQQHVTGAGSGAPHIIWFLYATERPPSEVREFYTGRPGEERAEAPAEVQLRDGNKLLTVYPATSRVYPRCGVEPKATDKTVIIVSELISTGQ